MLLQELGSSLRLRRLRLPVVCGTLPPRHLRDLAGHLRYIGISICLPLATSCCQENTGYSGPQIEKMARLPKHLLRGDLLFYHVLSIWGPIYRMIQNVKLSEDA